MTARERLVRVAKEPQRPRHIGEIRHTGHRRGHRQPCRRRLRHLERNTLRQVVLSPSELSEKEQRGTKRIVSQ